MWYLKTVSPCQYAAHPSLDLLNGSSLHGRVDVDGGLEATPHVRPTDVEGTHVCPELPAAVALLIEWQGGGDEDCTLQ